MKKAIIKSLSTFLLLVGVFILTLYITFSWFNQAYIFPNHIIGKTRGAYFQSGNGTSEDPYIISTSHHFYNLSYLQNLGMFNDKKYYFKVADRYGNPTIIDFSDSKVLPTHKTIQPIGTFDYQFKGEFNGNNSVLKSYIVDGTEKQDIGTFGYVATGAMITNLFLNSPNIISNPTENLSTTELHYHNNLNVATGYIAGHLDEGAIVQYVYVIAPTITSLSNAFPNRTQYGLIGYTEADNGHIPGGPRDEPYHFRFDASVAGSKLSGAIDTFGGSYYVHGTTKLLNTVITKGSNKNVTIIGPTKNETGPAYSLSSLIISADGNSNPEYLYTHMKDNNFAIETTEGSYNREYIDLVGVLEFKFLSVDSYEFNIVPTRSFIVPDYDTEFIPTNYPISIILYVKPTNNKNNLGTIKASYSNASGNLQYNSGWSEATYLGDRDPSTKTNANRIVFTASTTGESMKASDAFTAVKKNDAGQMIVVNPEEIHPDFYVFILSNTNGTSKINWLDFKYTPPTLDDKLLTAISEVDFITESEIDLLKVSQENKATYAYSYVNFGYEITENQKLNITPTKTTETIINEDETETKVDFFTFNITYLISDSTYFYIDIINVLQRNIVIVVKNEQTGIEKQCASITDKIIEIKVDNNSVIVNGIPLDGT